MASTNNMDLPILPNEVWEIILKKLSSVKDIISCKKTCTTWKKLIETMFKD